MEINKKITAEFFKTEQNNEPVRESEDKKSVGADIMAVEMSWPIGYPRVRKLDTDLWEVRTSISDNRISRVLFTISGKKMILLHNQYNTSFLHMVIRYRFLKEDGPHEFYHLYKYQFYHH